MSSSKIRPYGTDSLSLKEFTQWVLAPQSRTTQEHLLDFLLYLQSGRIRRVYSSCSSAARNRNSVKILVDHNVNQRGLTTYLLYLKQ